MTADALSPRPKLWGLNFEQVQAISVWLMFASSFVVFLEPAPTDFLFVFALLLHVRSGLTVSALIMPLILYLLLYNIGGFLSYLQVMNEPKTTMFIIITFYMSLSGIFIAFLVAKDPIRTLAIIKNGWVVAAVVASVLGIIGYFNILHLGPIFAPPGRAQSTFKDPNVLSTFLILPALLLIQGFMLRTQRHKVLSLLGLIAILACWFLAFSRGAWVSLSAAALLMIVITFLLTPSSQLRTRIIFLSVVGLVVFAAILAILLSIPTVHDLFLDRFKLVQYYDGGEKGRFGNQLNSISLLLMRPFGFGPLQFVHYFGQDPHNSFLNGFATFGWLGGITYFLLTLSTIVAGFRSVLVRSPWQHLAIAVFCAELTTILQGVQIDTEHWRHFHYMLGLTWGLFAASMAYIPRQAPSEERRAA